MLDYLTIPFDYSFVPRALAIGSVTAITSGILSCWLILVGWSLLGDAVSHAVLPGVVLSYILGWPFIIGALIAALLAVGAVGTVREKTTLRSDTAIGVVFTSLFATGLVLVSVTPSGTNLMEILFGNLLGITDQAMVQVLVAGGLAFIIMVVRHRDITLWAFDASHARAIGVNTTLVRWCVLISLALVVVASMQAVGVILVVAMLITPGATAYLLTRRIGVMLVLSPALALVASFTGIIASFWWDISTGGTIVLTQAAFFLAAYLFAPREGLITTAVRQRLTN